MCAAWPRWTPTEVLGMAWWNGLSERDRAGWQQRAGSAIAADAWTLFKAKPTAADEVGLPELPGQPR